MTSIRNVLFASIPIIKGRKVKFPVLLWYALTVVAILAELFHRKFRNYMIFKGVFWHTIEQTNLYNEYPSEYLDVNHYGPFFSVIIAPFAMMPDVIGIFSWCMLNSFLLLYAIKKLPLSDESKLLILFIASIEMMTSTHNLQVNPMLTAWLIFAFILTEKGRDFWATMFIAAGFMVKLYGVAGLLFFVFSKNKLRFALSFIFWLIVMFFLPMLFSSPSFIISSYVGWWHVLIEKNLHNTQSLMQDISLMGFIRRSFHWPDLSNLAILVPASLLIILPLLRFQQYKYLLFRLSYLAIVLISVVILSTSAESATYVLAVTGAAIWYVTYPRTKFTLALLIFMLLLTSLSPTDLFPAYIRNNFIRPYSLKALPCIFIWLVLLKNISINNFSNIKSPSIV
jgi:hypothetical protein